MYPGRELEHLAERKRVLQSRIAVRRAECAAAATDLARPIGWIDRGVELWHRFAPMLKILAVPGAFALGKILKGRARGLKGALPRKAGKLGMVMSAIPLVLRGVKLFTAFRAQQAARRPNVARV